MKLANDMSQEELGIFLEETDKELKLLDNYLIRLEKSRVTPEIIQEIFRAAHTLRGLHPLGKFTGSLNGISEATIMWDGQVALTLDAATLILES